MRTLIDKVSTIIIRFIPAFLIITVPLFFLPLTPDFFGINKQYLIFATASVALVAYCLHLVARRQIRITLSSPLIPLALLALVNIASATLGNPNPKTGLMNTSALIVSLFIIFLTTTSTQKNSILVKSVIFSTIFAATLLSIFSLMVNFGILNNLPVPEWLKSNLFHPAGSPYHYLTFAIPVLLASVALGISSRNWFLKPLVLTSVIIIAAGSAFSLKLLLPSAGKSSMATLPYSAGWSIAVDTLKTPKSALIGTGPDTFAYTFTKQKPAGLNLNNRLWNLRFVNSSSELLTVLTTAGVLGIIFFILTYFGTLKTLISQKFLKDPETVFILFGLLGVSLLFILLPSSIPTTALGIVLLIAATVKLKLENHKSTKDLRLNLSAHSAVSDLSESSDKTPHLPILPWIFTVACMVLLAVFWTIASKIYSANFVMYQAVLNAKDNPVKAYNLQVQATQIDPTEAYLRTNLSQTYSAIVRSYLSKENITDEEKKKALEFAQEAVNEAKAAANLQPQDVTVWENFAAIARDLAQYNVQGASDWTLATYSQAITLDPTSPTLRVQLGTFYFLLGDADQAINVLNQAVNLKPNWNIPYLNLALIYKSKKDYARALAYAKEGKKYTETNSQDLESIDKEIAELEKLVPQETATPAPTSEE